MRTVGDGPNDLFGVDSFQVFLDIPNLIFLSNLTSP